MHKGLIITKFAGQVVPEAFLARALKEYNNCAGAAVATVPENGKVKEILSIQSTVGTDLKQLDELQTTFLEDAVVIFLGGTTNKVVTPESVQPIDLLLGKDGKPALVGFFDGEFPGYAQEKSPHSDAFFLTESYLKPKLAQIYKYAGGDIAKLMDELRGTIFQQEIYNTMVNRGQVTLLASTGEIMSFSEHNPDLKKFDWGWSSQHLGWVDEEKKDEPKPASSNLIPSRRSSAPQTEAPKSEAPAIVNKSSVPEVPPKSATSSTTTPEVKGKMVKGPDSLKGKQLKKWYIANAGYAPSNFHERPEVESRIHKSFADISPSQIQTVERSLPEGVHELKGDTSTKHISAAPQQAKTERVVMPIIPEEDRKLMAQLFNNGVVKKTLDKSSTEMPDPKSIPGMERKMPDFAKQIGMSGLEATFGWEYSKVYENFTKDLFAVLWFSTRNAYINNLVETGALHKKLAEANVKIAELSKAAPAPVAEEPKVEVKKENPVAKAVTETAKTTEKPATSTKADPAPVVQNFIPKRRVA